MVFVLVPIVPYKDMNVVEASGYNVNSAIAYAEAHWNDNNGLCAEFVAKCVQAGGINIPTYTLTNQVYDAIISKTGIQGQWLNLTSGGYALYSQNSNILSKGDVVISWCGDYGHTYRPHIMLCGGYDSGGYATFYAHNNARHNERVPASSGTCGVCGRRNGQLKAKVLHISTLSSTGEMTTPTITTNRDVYGVGETMYITWAKTSIESDFMHYWLIITNTDTKKECFGGATGSNGDVNANSYQFTIPEAGHYRINLYTVPYSDKEHRQKTDVKTVCTYEYDSETVNLGNDFYANIINTSNKKCLTADSNDNVTIRTATGNSNQLWHFIMQSNGSYEIVDCASGKALDDNNWGQTNGTNVSVFKRNNETAQRWFVRGTQGAYFLNASCGSAVLDIENNSSADGTNVQMYEKNGSGAQKFTIQKKSTLAKCDLTDMNKIHGGFKLYWNIVSGATKYEIYRRKLTDSAYTKIATVSGGNINSYDDRTCVTGTAYSYKVKAANNSGAGEYGKGYYSLYLDYTNLWSANISTDSIELSWDNVKGADGYYVYQQNADNTYTKIKDIESGMANGCTISGLKQNTTYNFIVRAYGRYTYNSKTTIYTGYKSNALSVTTNAYNGLVKENGAYYYYRNGVRQTDYTGLMQHTDTTWCYVIKGKWQPNYTGIVRNTNGKYYYVYKGRRNYSSKLVKYTDGSWLYVKNGEWQPKYTGMVKNTNGKYYYVYKGRRNYSSKLVKHTDGKWWYVKKGEWQPKYTGIVKQPSGKKYYVVKGKKKYKTGYVTVGGRRYRVVKGEVK